MRNQGINLPVLIISVLVIALAIWITLFPTRGPDETGRIREYWLGRDVTTRLGLDLQGGTQVLLRAIGENVPEADLSAALGVIEQRVNGLGVGEAVVQRAGSDRVIVELPGVDNPEQAVETLRGTGQLEFIDPQGQDLTGQIVRTTLNPEPAILRQLPTSGPAIPAATSVPTGTATLDTTAAVTQSPARATAVATGSPAVTATTAVTQTAAASPVAPTPDLASQINPTIFETITQGRDLDRGSVSPTTQQEVTGVRPAVSFAFRGESQLALARFSSANIGRPMCIVLDSVVLSCPVVQAALTDGSGVITVSSQAEATSIYNQLKFGALPVPMAVETSRTVTATLGADSLDDSLLAGIVGLSVVMLFLILYYRLPGLIAVLTLLAYGVIVFAVYRLLPVTLTLAGIAGFILSVGLAVDANVLIFGRLKEELRHGRAMRDAIAQSFLKARSAILDSNAATVITCGVLYFFGSSFGVSIVQGFAVTLFLGVPLSLFCALVISRLLAELILPLPALQNRWFYGLVTSRSETAASEG